MTTQTTDQSPAILNFDNFDLETHVRVVMRGEEPLFIVKDVCTFLNHTNSRKAVENLHEDELVSLKVTSGGQTRAMQAVTESGLYALIFRSRKAEAERFRRWVTSEVLPAIRRHGRYDPVELAKSLPPSARRALLMHEVTELENRAALLRKQADLCGVVPGQYTVWQWLLMQGEEPPKGGSIGNLSGRCKRLSLDRGLPVGEVKVVDHCGQITRLSRTAKTYDPEILAEVVGQSAA